MSDGLKVTKKQRIDRAIYLAKHDFQGGRVRARALKGTMPKHLEVKGVELELTVEDAGSGPGVYEDLTADEVVNLLLYARGLAGDVDRLRQENERLRRKGVSPQVNADDMFSGEAYDGG